MAERTMKVLICDEPLLTSSNGSRCERPAVQTVTLIVGESRFEKDLCQRHYEKYFDGARRKLQRKAVKKK